MAEARAACRIGTAGWAIPSRYASAFPNAGSHLQRYAGRLCAAEINSSFYKPHRVTTYQRWAQSVPADFRFSVKLPKTITHERRLAACEDLLDTFLSQAGGLGTRLGAVLVQLPPSLGFDREIVDAFFSSLRERTPVRLACEPRHADWFGDEAEALLRRWEVARVAADPSPVPDARDPGGFTDLAYIRLHGAPAMYRSDYDPDQIKALAARIAGHRAEGRETWCIFDNTTLGHALGNALSLANSGESESNPTA